MAASLNSKENELKAGNPPTIPEHVVLSFLGEEYLAGTVIDLGVHALDKTKITNNNVHCIPYDDIREYTFQTYGFQTLEFDEKMIKDLRPLYEYSRNLKSNVAGPSDEDPIIQQSIDILEKWMTDKYTELTGETNIKVVCSRHLIMRIAGCDTKSCQIPGNPLMHLDYINFEAAYDRQCRDQERQPIPVECPKLDQLIDIVNLWFPSEPIQDWPLGFINTDAIQIKDYIPIQLVSGSHSCSMRYKPELEVIYKNNMKPPEVYIFRSATQDSSKKGVMHGSFRIIDEPIKRYSMEIRCCIFKNLSGGGKNSKKNSKKNIKKSKKKYLKIF